MKCHICQSDKVYQLSLTLPDFKREPYYCCMECKNTLIPVSKSLLLGIGEIEDEMS
jgi:hypothetical protein